MRSILLLLCFSAASASWAGGSAKAANGAAWNSTLGALALPPGWPPSTATLPPLFVGGAPGFTVTAWAFVESAGPLWTLEGGASVTRLELQPGGAVAAWAGPAGALVASCSAPVAGAWAFVGLSVATADGLNATWTLKLSNGGACTGAGAAPAARWWVNSTLGGGGFSGWVASFSVYNDVAMTSTQLSALAAGSSALCGTRPPAPPVWSAGIAAVAASASSLGSGCLDPSTGQPAACSAAAATDGWPAGGGCGANEVITAGGADAYPTITLDLGFTKQLSAVVAYAGGSAGDPLVSYAVLVGDTPPQSAPHAQPFYRDAGQTANAACHVDDPGAPQQRGRAVSMPCAASGRYVTLQLLASGDGDGVLSLCQLVALPAASGGPAPPPRPPPPRGGPAGALAPPAAAGATHRYVAGGAGLPTLGNLLLDFDGALDAATTGVQAAGGQLSFSGAQPCASFAQPFQVRGETPKPPVLAAWGRPPNPPCWLRGGDPQTPRVSCVGETPKPPVLAALNFWFCELFQKFMALGKHRGRALQHGGGGHEI